MFKLQMRVTGRERKEVAGLIASHFKTQAVYEGVAQKHSSPNETETANEKYTFRVWLLRLGFIGEEYKVSRKQFLDRLSGDGSFRTKDQAQEAVRKRKDRRDESKAVV